MSGHWREYVEDRAASTAIWMGWGDEAREAYALRTTGRSPELGLRQMIELNRDNPTFGYDRALWHMRLVPSRGPRVQ